MSTYTPPPYSNVSGIYRVDDKHSSITLANYDGSARPGELVVSTADYSLWIGNAQGNLTPVTGGSGNGMVAAPLHAVQFNKDGTNFGGSSNFTWNDGTATLFVKGEFQMRGDIIPTVDNVYSLGSSTNSWKELHVAGNTIFIGGIPLSVGSNSMLNYDGNPIVVASPSGNTSIAGDIAITGDMIANAVITSNSVSANIFYGSGAGLSNINYANITGTYGDSNVVTLLANVPGSITASGNITGDYIYGNGAYLTGITGGSSSYSNANVSAYLPVYGGNIAVDVATANSFYLGSNTSPGSYFISADSTGVSLGETSAQYVSVTSSGVEISGTAGITIGSFSSGLINVVSAINLGANGNVAIGGGVSGQVLSTDGFGNLHWINNGGNGSAYGNSDVAAFLPLNTANVSGNFFIGDGSLLSNINVANIVGEYSNANVSAYLPVYGGNLLTDTSVANTVVLGNATTSVNQYTWITAMTSSTANANLFTVSANSISSINFGITATSGNNRQVSKILAVALGNSFNYTEYGSLSIGSLLGNFFVDVISGNLILQVQPFTSANVHYSVIMDYDYDLHGI